MDEKEIQHLAAMYAGAKLTAYAKNQEHPNYLPLEPDNDELKQFANAYKYALENLKSYL